MAELFPPMHDHGIIPMVIADCKCPPPVITAVEAKNTAGASQVATLLSPGYPLDYCPSMECHSSVSFDTPQSSSWAVQVRFTEFSLDSGAWLDVGVLRQSAEPSNNDTLIR